MKDIEVLTTIRDFLRFSVSRFNEAGLYYGHGTDSAWDEAVSLILHSLHLPHDIDRSMLDAHLTSAERTLLLDRINKRVTDRIPVPYLTHEAWFGGLSFYVDERVLIPRSPIAELIENHFSPWLGEKEVTTILDLCTGSGCIGIACAKAFPDATVDITDISKDALAVAKINVLRHQVENQVTLHEANVFDGLPKKQYDIIVSNPPYVDEEDMSDLPLEYHHEPKLGLAAGKDGLDIVRKILASAKEYLTPDGLLVIEVGNSEFALEEAFPNLSFMWLEMTKSDGGVFLLEANQL